MKKGHSYINFYVKDKPNHPIVKALRSVDGDKWDECYIIYASHWATDSGWTMDGFFLGYTLSESIKQIKEGYL